VATGIIVAGAYLLGPSWPSRPGSSRLGSGLVHIGTRRSPVFTPRQAAELAGIITGRRGFRLVGVMGYEGQIAGLGDAPPGHPVRAQLIRFIHSRSVPELNRRRAEAIRLIQAVTSLECVNGGGTGSLEPTGKDTSVTELTAGSGLVGPTLFDAYTRFRPEPALLFALPVVRRPRGCNPETGSGCGTPRPANSPSVSRITTWSATTLRSPRCRPTGARASHSANAFDGDARSFGPINRRTRLPP